MNNAPIRMENSIVVSSAVKAATRQSSIAMLGVPIAPGYRPSKRKYSPVKTRKRPVGRPSKKPRLAHLELLSSTVTSQHLRNLETVLSSVALAWNFYTYQ